MKLIKRGKRWWVDYTANGVRRRVSTGSTNKAVALAWMQQIDVARRMPTFEAAVDVLRHFYSRPDEGKVPLEAIWETYERLAKATGKFPASEETVRKRHNVIDRLLRWIRAKRATLTTVEQVTGPVAAAFAERLAAEGLRTKTRRNLLGDLSTVWSLLEKVSPKISNPWLNLAPPDVDGQRGKAFTPDQERAVLEAAAKVGRDWLPVCQIMRGTGLRYEDVARLTWDEIQGDVIRLQPNKTRRHRIEVAIPMLDYVAEAVRGQPKTGDYLFPVHAELYGKRRETMRQSLRFREVLDLAGVTGSGYTIHSWRHTAATRLAEAGADIETRKRILGHTVDVTARRYDHDEHLEEVREALQAMSSGR